MTAMEAFEALGVIRWPLTFSLLTITVLALWSLRLVWRGTMPDRHARTWIDAILFWGGFAAVTGVLGTLVGIIIAAQAIETMGGLSDILAVASLLWFALQLRWRFLVAEHAGGPA